MEGNAEFMKGNYIPALKSYTKAIMKNGSNPTYYSNRAQCLLNLNIYDKALDDIEKAIEISQDEMNIKFLFKKILALTGLEEYGAAKRLVEKVLKVLSDLFYFFYDKDTHDSNMKLKSEFESLEEKLKMYIENTKGVYNIEEIMKLHMEKKTLDLADYINNKLEIKDSKDKGRGLFAREEIQAGELLMFTKCATNRKFISGTKDFDIHHSQNKYVNNLEFMSKFVEEIFEELQFNKLKRFRFNFLFGNKTPQESQNYPEIDMFKPGAYFKYNLSKMEIEDIKIAIHDLLPIYIHNGFNNETNLHKLFSFKQVDQEHLKGQGIWILPSFINHSCVPNCEKIFVDSYMAVQAMEVIKKGEEITLSYVPAHSYKYRQGCLSVKYNFECTCEFCKFDKENSFIEMTNSLVNNINSLIDTGNISDGLVLLKNNLISHFNKIDPKLFRIERMSSLNAIFIKLYLFFHEREKITKEGSKAKKKLEELNDMCKLSESFQDIRAKLSVFLSKCRNLDMMYYWTLNESLNFAGLVNNQKLLLECKSALNLYEKSNCELFKKWNEELVNLSKGLSTI